MKNSKIISLLLTKIKLGIILYLANNNIALYTSTILLGFVLFFIGGYMGLFGPTNGQGFLDNLFNPISNTNQGALVNDPVVQGRLNNERNSGVYNSWNQTQQYVPEPSPTAQLNYATTGSARPSGSVAGATTTAPTNNSAQSVDRSGTQNVDYYINEFGQRVNMDPNAQTNQDNQIRNEIGGAWDGYISSLDQQFGMLDNQRGGMEGQIGAQANKFRNTLGQQLGEGQTALARERVKTDANQKKNFQDLAEDQSNQMRAGNVFLGARGAGDSSASNMYSYALGRQGTKIRGDLMGQTEGIHNEINVREENLKKIYDTEINNTNEELNRGMSEIATWYADSQRQITQMKGEAGRDKGLSLAQMSYEVLNQAKARAQQLQDYAIQKQSAVEQWALNNSNTLAQARTNLAGVANFSSPGLNRANIQGASQMPGNATNTGYAPIGMGTGTDEKKNLTSLFG